jgi:hypothetical protein
MLLDVVGRLLTPEVGAADRALDEPYLVVTESLE